MVEPDAHWSQPASLRGFGWSENGDALLWDTSSRTPDRKFAVWESRSLDSLHRLEGNLSEALPLIQARARGSFGALGHDIDPPSAVRL